MNQFPQAPECTIPIPWLGVWSLINSENPYPCCEYIVIAVAQLRRSSTGDGPGFEPGVTLQHLIALIT
jgi:hypothetical protein